MTPCALHLLSLWSGEKLLEEAFFISPGFLPCVPKQILMYMLESTSFLEGLTEAQAWRLAFQLIPYPAEKGVDVGVYS